jgi:hypothetical protein
MLKNETLLKRSSKNGSKTAEKACPNKWLKAAFMKHFLKKFFFL